MENLKYPVGRYKPVPTYVWSTVQTQVEEIKNFPSKLADGVGSLTGEQFDTPYRPGGWTVRELVHHIADSHMNSYIRMKWALTEDRPTIKPYDQESWAQLADAGAPVDISFNLIRSLHQRWGYLLGRLTEDDWMKEYEHPKSGTQVLWRHIDHYAWHGRHHLAHITALIERKNWQ